MPKQYTAYLDDLIPLAEGRDGYFTSHEAVALGMSRSLITRLAQAGHIEWELPGVYRLTRWPAAKHPGLWPAFLWADAKGPVAFSHRSALTILGLSDINPAKIDLTFLDRMPRIRGRVPSMLNLRARPMLANDVTQIDGLPITRLKRTLVDLIVDNQDINAVDDVLERNRTLLTDDDYRALTALRELPTDLRRYLKSVVGSS